MYRKPLMALGVMFLVMCGAYFTQSGNELAQSATPIGEQPAARPKPAKLCQAALEPMPGHRQITELLEWLRLRESAQFGTVDGIVAVAMTHWMRQKHYRDAQELLAKIQYTKLIGWTDAGFGDPVPWALWIAECRNGDTWLVCSNDNSLVQLQIGRGESKSLAPLWKEMRRMVRKTDVIGPVNQIHGSVTVLMLSENGKDKCLYCYGRKDKTLWAPLFRSRIKAMQLLQSLLRQRVGGWMTTVRGVASREGAGRLRHTGQSTITGSTASPPLAKE